MTRAATGRDQNASAVTLPKELLICTTEPEEHRGVEEEINKFWTGKTHVIKLPRESLRFFVFDKVHLPSYRQERAVILLCHLCEGRTILTDADGLYNAFLVEALKQSQGQVFLGLTGLSAAHESTLADERIVAELVDKGQAAIKLIHASQRLMTWDNKPSRYQIAHLEKQLPPFSAPSSVLAAVKDASKPRRKAFCPILSIM